MKKYRAYNIEWETDGHNIKLPKSLTFELDDDQNPVYEGADVLSNQTGWLVKSFDFEIIKNKKKKSHKK